MTRNTAVFTRAGLVPAAAALLLLGGIAARAEVPSRPAEKSGAAAAEQKAAGDAGTAKSAGSATEKAAGKDTALAGKKPSGADETSKSAGTEKAAGKSAISAAAKPDAGTVPANSTATSAASTEKKPDAGTEPSKSASGEPEKSAGTSAASTEKKPDAGAEPSKSAGSEPEKSAGTSAASTERKPDAGAEPSKSAGSEPEKLAGTSAASTEKKPDAGTEPSKSAASEPEKSAGTSAASTERKPDAGAESSKSAGSEPEQTPGKDAASAEKKLEDAPGKSAPSVERGSAEAAAKPASPGEPKPADAADKSQSAPAREPASASKNAATAGTAATAALSNTPSSAPPTGVVDQVLPPADPIVAGVRQKIPDSANGANADEVAALAAFYEELKGPAIWVSSSGLTAKGKAAVEEIGKAGDWGLPASDFELPHLTGGELSADAAADAEIKLALAVLKYARYARGGRVNPMAISQLIDQSPTLVAPKTVLTDIAAVEAPEGYLRSLHPKHKQFELLRQALLKLRGSNAKEEEPVEDPALSVKIPPGRVIKAGAEDPQVALLRQRLKVPADDQAKENVYDEKLQEAVREFQRANGLRPDAVIGNGTRNVLNGQPKPESPTNEAKIERVLINMERWRWMPEDLGKLYVWDNVPEFLTRVVKDNKVIHTDKIIVGQPSWPTPIFSADMKMIVFHPSWGVPEGIKRKELLPLLRKSSGAGFFGIFGGGYSSQAVLDAYELRAYYNGRPIDPNQVDWNSVNIGAYSFQQPPGPKNVLGIVKFMFPNKHDVYMHDTPERHLFVKSFRALSHGCMRVEEPRRLAEILLGEDKGWSPDKVRSMFGGYSTEVALDTHIPVHVTYFTARVDDDGKLQTFGDFYGLDSRIASALLGKSVRFESPVYVDDEVAADAGAPMTRREAGRKKPYQGPDTLADAINGLFSP